MLISGDVELELHLEIGAPYAQYVLRTVVGGDGRVAEKSSGHHAKLRRAVEHMGEMELLIGRRTATNGVGPWCCSVEGTRAFSR